MLFNSLTFLIFFIVVFTLHRVMPGWSAKKLLLLIASYVFYAAWNPPYVVILLFSTSLDWWLARLVWKSQDPRRRRLLLTVSLVANLSLLGFFKYGNFLLDNTRLLLGAFGVHYAPPGFDIVLPIGISFYTFASLSYTIDVYRREIEGDAPYLDYALFVSFFPHLVAGPIVRARQLLPQIATPRSASRDQLGWGLCLVIIGLFTKTVLADAVFAPVVDAAYANPALGALESWAAVLGFSGQIYCDFAGYSLCAIGLALCFGFEFPDNFRYPYGARGFSDFWRRWHITLSTWLRDSLYIPLGGNRHGEGRTYLSL
jgi:alginate O-acetyltransferase complex protein AlgI